MARILAIDWDRHEARYVLATASRGKVKVVAVESISLVDVAEGGEEPKPDLSGSLAAALADQAVARAVTLVGVERSSIELLQFVLPPAKDTELPELVANQAMRESQLITEQSVIDFLVIGSDPSVPRSVTAAAMSSEELGRIQRTCEAAGVKPTRMLLRPFASASLFARTESPPETCLLVNRINAEVDLTILAERKPVFFRTIRLPESANETQVVGRLLAEINRTLAAAPESHLGDETVQCIYVFGRSDDHQGLVDQIRDGLSLPAKVFDAFEALHVPERLVPAGCGRFAPLLGMVLDEAAGSHAVDFLHPKKIPQPVNRRRLAIIGAGAIAAVILGVAFNVWSTWSEVNRENAALTKRLREVNATIKKTSDKMKLIEAVRNWRARDVIWLDELRDLSLRFPPPRDAVVLRMSMTFSQSGGSIDLEGLVRDPKIVVNMEGQVRDRYRTVVSRRVQERKLERDYTWLFETSMSVAPRDEVRDQGRYVAHLPEDRRPASRSDDLADTGASNGEPETRKTSQ